MRHRDIALKLLNDGIRPSMGAMFRSPAVLMGSRVRVGKSGTRGRRRIMSLSECWRRISSDNVKNSEKDGSDCVGNSRSAAGNERRDENNAGSTEHHGNVCVKNGSDRADNGSYAVKNRRNFVDNATDSATKATGTQQNWTSYAENQPCGVRQWRSAAFFTDPHVT
jgi:hypothetical protein